MFVNIKGNLGPPAPARHFTIKEKTLPPPHDEIKTAQVVWSKEDLQGSAFELVRDAEGTEADDLTAVSSMARDEALEFLRSILAEGEVDSHVVKAKAKEQGISENALRRAREQSKEEIFVRRSGRRPRRCAPPTSLRRPGGARKTAEKSANSQFTKTPHTQKF